MVSRCMAKEVQRNAKWGFLMWERRVGKMKKRESGVGKERG